MQLESLEENPGWVPGNFAGSPKASLGLPTKDVLFGMRAVLGSILGGRGLSAGDEQVPIRCLDWAVVTQGTPLSYIPAPGARRNPRGAKPQTPSHSSRGRHALPRGFITAHERSASQPYSVFFFPSSAVFPAQPERVAVVTGGTDGIGYATAKCLAKLGMHVIIAGNNDGKALEVVRKIKEETLNEKVEFLYCDLASMRSVRQFVQKFKMKNIPLHVLVNNAGVMMVPERSTEDGYEEHFGVNYLGHFLLTNLLLDTLKASGSPGRSARVVTVSSATHYVGELNLDDLQSRNWNDQCTQTFQTLQAPSQNTAKAAITPLFPSARKNHVYARLYSVHCAIAFCLKNKHVH
nr:dehydrogenase/reductase SDR family member on chromosome X isoform X3 [Vicugna pacos]